jgi:hypothetical protein
MSLRLVGKCSGSNWEMRGVALEVALGRRTRSSLGDTLGTVLGEMH